MYLFFLQRGKEHGLSQSAVTGRQRFIARFVFGFPPVLIQPLRGVWGCRAACSGWVWKGERQPFRLQGRHSLSVLDCPPPPPPPALLEYPRAQLAWHLEPAIVSVVTHSHQTPLEILDKVGSRDIFNFISSGKTFGVCLMAPSKPWLPWGQLPSAGGAWGEWHSSFPPQSPGHPPTGQESPEGWRGPSTQKVLSRLMEL